jgi:hypothetical protein
VSFGVFVAGRMNAGEMISYWIAQVPARQRSGRQQTFRGKSKARHSSARRQWRPRQRSFFDALNSDQPLANSFLASVSSFEQAVIEVGPLPPLRCSFG